MESKEYVIRTGLHWGERIFALDEETEKKLERGDQKNKKKNEEREVESDEEREVESDRVKTEGDEES